MKILLLIYGSLATAVSANSLFDAAVLKKRDLNHDGFLTEDEMLGISSSWEDFLHFSDGNGDGRLSVAEAQISAQKTLDLILGVGASSRNSFDAGVALADKNNDGFLTERELPEGELEN